MKSVTLLSNIHKSAREHFAEAGIRTLNQIVELEPEALRQFRGIKTTAHAIHASARAWVGEKPVWYKPLDTICRSSPVYFDIETIPEQQNKVWSIGWAMDDGHVQVVLVDPFHQSGVLKLPDGQSVMLVTDTDSAWQYFAACVSGDVTPVFHWSPYDATRVKNDAPVDVQIALRSRLRDLCRLFDSTVKLPVKGVSLKTIGTYFGFSWRGYDNFQMAYFDYQRWLQSENLTALASAIAYQQDDVSAMRIVRRWLVDNAPDEI